MLSGEIARLEIQSRSPAEAKPLLQASSAMEETRKCIFIESDGEAGLKVAQILGRQLVIKKSERSIQRKLVKWSRQQITCESNRTEQKHGDE